MIRIFCYLLFQVHARKVLYIVESDGFWIPSLPFRVASKLRESV